MASRRLAERYRLEQPLGTSLMAEVHRATDLELDRQVVVKLLRADADRTRFEREARAVAGLAHTNIVQVFDYGEDDGRPYLVFEYLSGQSLHERLSGSSPLPDADTSRIALDIAAGLAHAHERGVVHRDLKPANVLFDSEDRAKIADFGIANVAGADTITDAGTVLGTAAYISPEQVRGEPATPASDVYAFGVVLYQMLSGRLPFAADNAAQLAVMHRDMAPPPLASVRPDAPPGLAGLTDAALAKDPGSRPQDGASLVASLTADASPPAPSDAQTRVLPAIGPRRRRTSPLLLAGLSLLLLLTAGTVAAVVLTGGGHPAPAVPAARSTHTRPSKHTTSQPTTSASTTTPTSSIGTTRPVTSTASPSTSAPASVTLPPPTTAASTPLTTAGTKTTDLTTTVP